MTPDGAERGSRSVLRDPVRRGRAPWRARHRRGRRRHDLGVDGAPARAGVAACSACRAALEISRAIDAFNERNHPRTMPTRIGLNAGWAMVGNVGGSGRYVYSVVGDCVNTASRLESLNKQLGTRIIAAACAWSRISRRSSAVRSASFQLCGKGEAMQLVELVGIAADEPERAGAAGGVRSGAGGVRARPLARGRRRISPGPGERSERRAGALLPEAVRAVPDRRAAAGRRGDPAGAEVEAQMRERLGAASNR